MGTNKNYISNLQYFSKNKNKMDDRLEKLEKMEINKEILPYNVPWGDHK